MKSSDKTIIEIDELQETTYVIQKMIGKLLNHSDIGIIVNLHKSFGLKYSEIENVFRYCISKGNRNINSIEKIAIDYAQKGETVILIEEESPRKRKGPKAYLPFADDEIDDLDMENGLNSPNLKEVKMQIQVTSEYEKNAMIKVLEKVFFIDIISEVFQSRAENSIDINLIVSKR